jgi:hypothetical protein
MECARYFYLELKRKFSLLYSREKNLRKATTITKIFAKMLQKLEFFQRAILQYGTVHSFSSLE